MAKKKKSNAGIFVLLLLALPVFLWQQSPLLAALLGAGVLAVAALVIYGMRPRRCDVCGNALQRKTYEWTIEGEKKRVCPHCNRSLAAKQSKAAMKQFR
jgi:hypothetical protein